ncbi:hypothetical protein CCZ01_05575 [Helicobacter monodelphidis]|uniref:DMT family transporter n=1 Tax=Helicobacter sp. 15-1451 TaxID=2004995 RepID=UPI000DCD7B9C|nr:DMT family transporter [Helicobacter sp. 15-1451]RAX57611.1 hypothetical protein CCZ01_05575 [Helicobacter sp. 15-1451]
MAHYRLTSGILYMLTSSFCFALMNAFAKALSQHHIPSMQNVFLRSLVMVFIMVLIYLYQFSSHKPKKQMKKGGVKKLIIRLSMGGFAMLCIFYNIATMPLGIAIAFAQSMPLYAVLMGVLFLGEKLNLMSFVATLVGFVGLLLMSNPNVNELSFVGIIVGILSGVCMAAAFVTLRSLREYFSNEFLVFAFGLSTTFLGFLGLWIPIAGVGGFTMPNMFEWVLILAMGLSGTVAQFFLNKAYMNAPVGVVAPIDYFRIIFSVLLGIALGDALPNLSTILGMGLIIVGGLIIAAPALMSDIKKINPVA